MRRRGELAFRKHSEALLHVERHKHIHHTRNYRRRVENKIVGLVSISDKFIGLERRDLVLTKPVTLKICFGIANKHDPGSE